MCESSHIINAYYHYEECNSCNIWWIGMKNIRIIIHRLTPISKINIWLIWLCNPLWIFCWKFELDISILVSSHRFTHLNHGCINSKLLFWQNFLEHFADIMIKFFQLKYFRIFFSLFYILSVYFILWEM